MINTFEVTDFKQKKGESQKTYSSFESIRVGLEETKRPRTYQSDPQQLGRLVVMVAPRENKHSGLVSDWGNYCPPA